MWKELRSDTEWSCRIVWLSDWAATRSEKDGKEVLTSREQNTIGT